jgi:Ca2+-binding RTX toxin-like protein
LLASAAVPLADAAGDAGDDHGDDHGGGHDDGGDDGHDHEAEIIEGTNKSDTINAGGGPQEIYGGNGRDNINAQGGPDVAYGGNGRDMIYGGGGPDTLFGGNGRDILVGGRGMDMLTGGRGPDIFLYTAPQDVPGHGPCDEGRRETITDFNPNNDKFDFVALGLEGFSDSAEGYHAWAEQEEDDTILYVDTDGNLEGEHPAEMGIVLFGVDAGDLSGWNFMF